MKRRTTKDSRNNASTNNYLEEMKDNITEYS